MSASESSANGTKARETPGAYGVVAEFTSPHDILHAAHEVRSAGFKKLDAYTPFPVHGLDTALGHPGSKIPWIVLMGACFGGGGGLLLQWWTSAVDYPLQIAGKPFFSLPAFVPITFELGVLFSAFAALGGMLLLNKLPRPYHPVFTHTRFTRVTDDTFLLAVEADDPGFDLQEAQQALSAAGGRNIEVLES
jgi:hypothetical protein